MGQGNEKAYLVLRCGAGGLRLRTGLDTHYAIRNIRHNITSPASGWGLSTEMQLPASSGELHLQVSHELLDQFFHLAVRFAEGGHNVVAVMFEHVADAGGVFHV